MNQQNSVRTVPTSEQVPFRDNVPAKMRLQELILLVKNGRRIVMGFTATAIFLTGLLLLNATPRYVAVSQMLLGEQGLIARNSFDLVEEQQSLTSSVIEGELAVLRSNVLLHRVAERLELENIPEFNPDILDQEKSPSFVDGVKAWVKSLLTDSDLDIDAEVEDLPSEISVAASASASQLGEYKDIVSKLRRSFSVRQQGTSYVVQVTAESEDPELAAALSNTLMDEYVKFLTDKRFDSAREFTHWLETRVTDLAVTLEESERAVVDYRARMEADADNRSRLDQQMTELTSRLVQQRSELAQITALRDKMESTLEEQGPLAAQLFSSSEEMVEYRSQMSSLKQREANAVGRFGEDSAQVVSIRRTIGQLEDAMETEVRRELDRLENQREVLTVVVGSMDNSLAELSRLMLDQSGEEIQLSQLRRVADANRQVYQQFLGRFKELSELQSLQNPDAEIISYANPPSAPVYPRRKLSLLLATFGGVFLGVAYLLFRNMLPKKLATEQQLAQETGVSVYGSVRDISDSFRITDLCTNLNREPQSDLAKQAMLLANNVDMRSGGFARTILVNSDADRTDRLNVVIMLAWAYGRMGRNCVFIDADIRGAQMSSKLEYLKPKSNLVDVIYNNGDVKDALTRMPDVGAIFMPTEVMAGINPSVVFDTARYQNVVEALLGAVDTVIIMPPPASSFTEAYTATGEIDSNLFVVRAGTSIAAELEHPLSIAQSANARNFGFILMSS
jgi:uncharacterized protein involved in exopolysaccharide biosynthesis/Mrp family chromosome partitioning ATPase